MSNSLPGLGSQRSATDNARETQLIANLLGDEPTRERAARELGALGSISAVDGLLGRLTRDNSPKVRLAAAEALRNIGDRRTWPVVADVIQGDKGIQESDKGVLAKLIELLGVSGDSVYALLLVKLLTGELVSKFMNGNRYHYADWMPVRQAIIKSIGLLKSPEVVPALLDALAPIPASGVANKQSLSSSRSDQVKDPIYADDCILALASMGSLTVKPVLESTIHLPVRSAFVRQDAKYEPEKSLTVVVEQRTKVLAQIGGDAVTVIADELDRQTSNVNIRQFCANALARIDTEASTLVLEFLVTRDSDAAVQYLALGGLAGRTSSSASRAIAAVCEAILNGTDSALKVAVLEATKKCRINELLPAVRAAARNDSAAAVRAAAADVLGVLGDKSAIDLLGTLASGQQPPEVQRSAIVSLGQLRDPSCLQYLHRAMTSYLQRAELIAAGNALRNIASPQSIPVLLGVAIAERDSEVFHATIDALAIYSDPQIARSLGQAATSSVDEYEQRKFIEALGNMPSIDAFNQLLTLQKNPQMQSNQSNTIAKAQKKWLNATTLQTLSTQQCGQVFELFLTRPGDREIEDAIRHLHELGDRRAIPALQRVYDRHKREKYSSVGDAAKGAIAKLQQSR